MKLSEHIALEKLEVELKSLISTPHGRRAFLASLPFLLASCSSKSKHRSREGDNTGQQAALTVEEERRLTQEALPEMRKEYPPYPNDEAQRYLSNLGMKVAKSNGLEGNPYNYNFTLVKADFVNAFALPAGTVMVTTPLLAMAENEAELAGVIGHEIGHVKSRHTAERMHAAKSETTKSILFGAAGAVLGGAAGFGLGKLLCSKGDRDCVQRAALYGGIAGVGGGLLIQKFAFMANSREDEMEADRIGFRTSVNAGYDKVAAGSFYSKLLEMEKQHKQGGADILRPFADAMSTHPPSEERVQQMQQMASSEPSNPKAIVSTPEFEKIKRAVSG